MTGEQTPRQAFEELGVDPKQVDELVNRVRGAVNEVAVTNRGLLYPMAVYLALQRSMVELVVQMECPVVRGIMAEGLIHIATCHCNAGAAEIARAAEKRAADQAMPVAGHA